MFDTAFVTLFHVTAGEPWPDELLMIREDGTTDWVVAGYELCFTIIVIWVILQASAACVRARPCGAARGRCQLPSASGACGSAGEGSPPGSGARRNAAVRPRGRWAARVEHRRERAVWRARAWASFWLGGRATRRRWDAGWPPARRLLRAGACPGGGGFLVA